MDQMLYVALSGAKQIMQAQTANAHNLANISTTGFKEDLAMFGSQGLAGPGYPTRVYAVNGESSVDLSPGAMLTTGNDLDVAINGEGWIAIQDDNGEEAYTRAGDLHISTTGELLTGSGKSVIGNSGSPIAIPPAEKIEIGDDGTISIRPVGQAPTALVTVDRIKLVNPKNTEMAKGLDGLMHLKEGGVAAPDAKVTLVSGSLEGSNVNAVEAMVKMIALARQFEAQVKMMSVAEENDSASTQLMRIT